MVQRYSSINVEQSVRKDQMVEGSEFMQAMIDSAIVVCQCSTRCPVQTEHAFAKASGQDFQVLSNNDLPSGR